MKLIRFGNRGNEKPGIMLSGKRFDCSPYFEDWNREFFINYGLQELENVCGNQILKEVPASERWAGPIARPGIIICVGFNYSDHAKESGMELSEEPVLFMKATNTINGPFDEVNLPKGSQKTDWEVELGLVLNQDILYIKDEIEAENDIGDYTIVYDLSERDFQLNRGGQWVKGKSCSGFSHVGPYLVTREEINNLMDLNMSLTVNGEVKQLGNTSSMVFNPGYLVWYISQFMMLEARNLISTGTPPGVGLAMNPPQYLKNNDLVELNIDNLGSQKQRFVNY